MLRNGGDSETDDVDAFEDSIKILRHVSLKKKYTAILAQATEYMASGNPDYVEKFRESLKIKDEMDDL